MQCCSDSSLSSDDFDSLNFMYLHGNKFDEAEREEECRCFKSSVDGRAYSAFSLARAFILISFTPSYIFQVALLMALVH